MTKIFKFPYFVWMPMTSVVDELQIPYLLYTYCHNRQCFLSKGRSFTSNSETNVAILPNGRSFTANSESKVAVLQGMNRCSSVLLISAPHFLFNVWTVLKRSEKIPGASAWRLGEWIWLAGPSRLHRNSPLGLNISSIGVFDQVRDPEIPITHRPHRYCII